MYKTLDSVSANASIRAYYRKTLLKMINRLYLDANNEIKKCYNKRQQDIVYLALDASPMQDLIDVINNVFSNWQKVFNDKSNAIANKVYNDSDIYYKKRLKKILGTISIDVDKTTLDIIRNKRANIIANVELIKSIPQEYKNRVIQAVTQAVVKGYDLEQLSKNLIKIGNITKNRAITISRDQVSKINSSIQHTKWNAIGITEAIWQHSTAGKTYRVSHVKADGKKYDIKKGMYLDGQWILPGELINCRCTSRPQINLDEIRYVA